jgi:hypothetical protein
MVGQGIGQGRMSRPGEYGGIATPAGFRAR